MAYSPIFQDVVVLKGASKGEGLGNKFLSYIRETDAIVQVVRCFEDTNVVHVDGVELYKKIITGNGTKQKEKLEKSMEKNESQVEVDKDTWKSHFNENPNLIEYGNNKAEVIDYGVFDENNLS